MGINDFNKLYCVNDLLDEIETDIEEQEKNVFIYLF